MAKTALYKLSVAYNGTRYHGFQRQIDNTTMMNRLRELHLEKREQRKRKRRGEQQPATTVQQVLETVLLHLYPQEYNYDVSQLQTRFAGRTDKGVHARGQVVVVRLPKNTTNCDTSTPATTTPFPLWTLRRSIQSRLPKDISIQHLEELSSDEDANGNHTTSTRTPTRKLLDPRHDVVEKEYSYTIKYCLQETNSLKIPDACVGTPFLHDAMDIAYPSETTWFCPWPLPDASMFQPLAQSLCGTHDYSHFCHPDVEDDDHRLTVDSITYEVVQRKLLECGGSTRSSETDNTPSLTIVTGVFRFRGRKFHRSMVRKLVGYMVDVLRPGSDETPAVEQALRGQDKEAVSNTISSAPACGLCLEYVKY